MDMQTFENQNNLRVSNQIKVLSTLKKGPQSLNALAERLNVSFTAISKIIDELEENNVVTKYRKKSKNASRGRTPVNVKINTSIGVTAAIDLSRHKLCVAICDLDSHLVIQDTYAPEDHFQETDIYLLGDMLKRLLKSPDVGGRPLLGICISCPGMIYSKTGEIKWSSKIQTYNKLSPLTYFFNEFGVPTHLYNDAKISMVGEKIYGCIPSDAKNYLFLHIGNAVGMSFSFNGKLYQGKSGFSGELTNLNLDADPICKENRNMLYGFEYIAHDIQEADPTINVYKKDVFINKDKIIDLYQKEEPTVTKIVNGYIKKDAIQIIAYCDLLDLEYVIIEGSFNKLGPKFKDLLLKYINEFDRSTFGSKILFSSLETPASLLGAMYQANNIYFLNRLEKITNQKSGSQDYDISESFGENI